MFLKYIEKVLPSLGETGAVLLTPGQLFPGVDTTLRDSSTTSAVKGDLRMVKVLSRAVRNYQRIPASDIELSVGLRRVTLTRDMVKTARERARRSGYAHNRAREVFATTLMNALAQRIVDNGEGGASQDQIAEIVDDVRRSRDARVLRSTRIGCR